MHTHRRNWLAWASACLLLPFAALGAPDPAARERSLAAWRRRLESMLDQRRVPMIDLQATYVAEKTHLARVMAYMDELDIAQTAFAVAQEPNGFKSVELHRQYPEYFIPTTNSGEFARWWTGPEAFLQVVRSDLQSGQYFFMGEHEFRHYPSPEQVAAGQFQRDITVAIDSPAGDLLFALSAETGIAFQIHYEIEDALLPALEAVLGRHPKARPIWCHLAMVRYPERATRYGPDYVRSLIERFPGLHFDLAVPAPSNIYQPSGARDSTLFDPSGRIQTGWMELLEQYPERFLAATDYRPPVEASMPRYIATVQRKLILDTLSERSRHLVAYGNAWRLITGEPWR